MKVQGSIVQLKSRVNASGETVQTVSLEVFGDFAALHSLMKKPLSIQLDEQDKSPFEQ